MIILEPTKMDAIQALVDGKVSGYSDGSELVYQSGVKPPSESAIQAKLSKLTAEWNSQEYARKRKAEYDALNQFELMTDDAENGTTTHADAIKAIKKKYPKG